jgi:hypothetical protein
MSGLERWLSKQTKKELIEIVLKLNKELRGDK